MRIFIKTVFLHALAGFGYLLGLPLWRKLFRKDREVRILLYHGVSPSRKNDMDVLPAEFEKQLDFLTKHYEVVSLETAVKFILGNQRPPRPVVALTFDDGYENNYHQAYPLLKRRGVPATIFLITGQEGPERNALYLKDYLPDENRLLNWSQIKEMASSVVTFGSHGETHGRLRDLSAGLLARELLSSKERIESEIGKPVQFFSYPYGHMSDFGYREQQQAQEAGYRAAFTAMLGTNGVGANLFRLRRIGIEASDSLFTFRAKLNGALSLLAFFQWPLFRKILHFFDTFFIQWVLRRGLEKAGRQTLFLLVSVDFPPHTDGVSTISAQLSARLARRGCEVAVIGPKDQRDREFDAVQPYRVFRVPGYEWGYFRFLPIVFSMPYVIFRYGVRRVFAMNIAYGGVLAWLLSWVRRLDYLLFAYGYEFEKVKGSAWIKALYLKIYSRSKGIIACSEEVKKRLVDFGVWPQKIHVLYPAVDYNRYKPRQVPSDFLAKYRLQNKKIILTVGRIIQRKGHEQVIRALPEITPQFPETVYCIAGAGPYREELEHRIRRLGTGVAVRFLGKVPAEDLPLLYNACDVFVMPSCEKSEGGHIEGFGIVFLEANACAKPVIGGRSGGVIEAIRDGETGFLVDPDSPREIAEKILFLFSHPEVAKKMGEQGLAWVRRSFDWDSYVQKSYDLLMGEDLL